MKHTEGKTFIVHPWDEYMTIRAKNHINPVFKSGLLRNWTKQ